MDMYGPRSYSLTYRLQRYSYSISCVQYEYMYMCRHMYNIR